MIKWTSIQTENHDEFLHKVKIGEPSKEFWIHWRNDEEKEQLIEQGFKLISKIVDGKSKWYVKRSEYIIKEEEEKEIQKNVKEVFNSKLLPHQHQHFNNLFKAFFNGTAIADLSDTGTGKTSVNLAIVKELKRPVAIVCLLAGVPVWVKWCKRMGVKPVFIANYETFKHKGNNFGKIDKKYYPYKVTEKFPESFKIKKLPENENVYTNTWSETITYLKNHGYPSIEGMIAFYERKMEKPFPKTKCRDVHNFYWNVPENTMFIFDEIHQCKTMNTQNSKMLVASKNYPVAMLSATLGETPRDLWASGYILGLHNMYNFTSWLKKNSCYQNHWGAWKCSDPVEAMKNINKKIIPRHGSRMRKSEIEGWPDCQIIAECYGNDVYEKYNKKYTALMKEVDRLHEEGAKSAIVLAEITKFRQATELMKIPLYINLAKTAIQNGCSVLIFVNYTDTRLKLQKALKCKYAIYGQQPYEERERCKELFQHGKIRLLILMSDAGGASIDLHNEHDNYPRESIISPTYRAITLTQVFGRTDRAGSKTKTVLRLPYLSGTIEESVCSKVNAKIDNINALNDGDLMEEDILKLNIQEEKTT